MRVRRDGGRRVDGQGGAERDVGVRRDGVRPVDAPERDGRVRRDGVRPVDATGRNLAHALRKLVERYM